jgi:hypothetical protein
LQIRPPAVVFSGREFAKSFYTDIMLFVSPFERAGHLSALILALWLLPGCNALNPLCGSARPAPVLDSISPSSLTFSQLPPNFTLTATGSHFVSASVVVFNGTSLTTSVNSSSLLTVTITASMIPAPGNYNVRVHTPAGTTGNLGCSSGGDSAVQVLTVN